MHARNRRQFLGEVGQGMLIASIGATAWELGLTPAWADPSQQRLTFGALEPLVDLMQETPPEQLMPLLVERIQSGTDLKTLASAAALANARAFGGQDYTGYHAFMALVPAYQMSQELSGKQQALPVLKVLYRNTNQIHLQDADHKDAMHPIQPASPVATEQPAVWLRDAVRQTDWQAAEARFAALAQEPNNHLLDHLQWTVQDEVDVHRVVLAWRAWAMLGLAGQQFAQPLLRQSVRYCLQAEQNMRDRQRPPSDIRQLLPRLLDEHQLLARPVGDRQADDKWIDSLAKTVAFGDRQQAAEAVAMALAEGFDPEAVGEALSVAANLLVLHDPGRRAEYSSAQKPPGCVHGDSVGVHASDAANAWRNIARVSNTRNQFACLIVAAYHTAGQTPMITSDPYPYADRLDQIQATDGPALLALAEEAIRGNDQARACAIVHRYGQLNLPSRPVFDLLLRYAISEDGALHAEKYYRTVTEEFASVRPAFRWRQLVALARVTASEFGFPAPGYAQACDLLGIKTTATG